MVYKLLKREDKILMKNISITLCSHASVIDCGELK